MKVVVAIDSLKGSLSSLEAGEAARRGILRAVDAQVVVKPLADGGEGTMEAIVAGAGGKKVSSHVIGPLGGELEAQFGYLEGEGTAVIEMAAAAGITLVEKEALNPMAATTFGVGQMIREAIGMGCRKFVLGIGGSATNDGGAGMLSALGYEFLAEDGYPVEPGAVGLGRIAKIRDDHVMPELSGCQFLVACDVTNPLCGGRGATYVYGPQKGVTQEQKPVIDGMMNHFADVTAQFLGRDARNVPGSGAAGGMGFACISYLNAVLKPGIQVVMEAVGLETCLKDADYVVTGEGRLDGQSAMGKAPVGVARLAKRYKATVIALAGSVEKGAAACHDQGIDAYFPILPGILTLEQAMDRNRAAENMARAAEEVFRLILSVTER